MVKARKILVLSLFVILICTFLFNDLVYASQKYCYAQPSEQYPGQQIAIHWNYEYPHETILEIENAYGDIVYEKTISKSSVEGNFEDNVVYWYGKNSNGSLVSPGYYLIKLIPNDEWRNYPSTTSVVLLDRPKDPAKLNITIQSPTTLTINGNGYKENDFTITASIHNSGEMPVNDVQAQISNSSGLILLSNRSRFIGTIPAGETTRVTWTVRASNDFKNDRTERITISSTSSSAPSASKIRDINVPGLVVIFVPGLMGSDLYYQKEKVWYDLFGINEYDLMVLNSDGTPVNWLEPEEPIDLAYGKAVQFLKNNDFNVVEFPYDWRLSNEYNAQHLSNAISETRASKVYIVAHSMGGLVSNRYITMGNANKVAKLITIGTPYMGSPKALYGIETGDLLSFTNSKGIKQVAINSPSAYQLLPSREYFSLGTYYFSKGNINNQGFLEPVKNYTDYESMLNYLNTDHPVLTEGFAAKADEFQNKLDIENSGVDAYNIVGYGLGTPGEIQERFVYNKQKHKWVLSEVKRMRFIDGDETVPLISANRSKQNGKYHTWYRSNVGHMELMSDDNVLNQVKGILTNGSLSHLPTTYTTSKRLGITINSPVDLHIYDKNGNYIGPEETQVDKIPLASYYEWDHNKFASLNDGSYNVKLKCTDSGTFSFTIDYYDGEEIENTVLFKDVPIENGAIVTTQINTYESKDIILSIDNENDGIIDRGVMPTSILDSSAVDDIIPPTVKVKFEGIRGNNNWFTTDTIVYLDAIDEGGSRLKTVEYQLNNDDYLTYEVPFTINTEGITRLSAIAMDCAGNTSLNLVSEDIKVDKSVPNIEANLNSEYVFGTELDIMNSIQVTDTVSGVNNTKIYFDDTLVTTQTITLNQDGLHTIKVVAEDNAGLIRTYQKTFDVYIPANINFDPDTFNIKNDNPSVSTVYIDFPEGFDVSDIQLSSIQLNGLVSPIQDERYGYVLNPIEDFNGDGKPEFMVKFRRSELATILTPGDSVEILVTGRASGVLFKGKDYIRVIN